MYVWICSGISNPILSTCWIDLSLAWVSLTCSETGERGLGFVGEWAGGVLLAQVLHRGCSVWTSIVIFAEQRKGFRRCRSGCAPYLSFHTEGVFGATNIVANVSIAGLGLSTNRGWTPHVPHTCSSVNYIPCLSMSPIGACSVACLEIAVWLPLIRPFKLAALRRYSPLHGGIRWRRLFQRQEFRFWSQVCCLTDATLAHLRWFTMYAFAPWSGMLGSFPTSYHYEE